MPESLNRSFVHFDRHLRDTGCGFAFLSHLTWKSEICVFNSAPEGNLGPSLQSQVWGHLSRNQVGMNEQNRAGLGATLASESLRLSLCLIEAFEMKASIKRLHTVKSKDRHDSVQPFPGNSTVSTTWPAILLLSTYPGKSEVGSRADLCAPASRAALLTAAQRGRQPTCLVVDEQTSKRGLCPQ